MSVRGWRVSLRKSLKEGIWKRQSKARQEDLKEESWKNEIVQFRGISLSALERLWEKIVRKQVVPDTELFELKHDMDTLTAGETVVLVSRKGASVKVKARLHSETFSLQGRDLRAKPREEWTVEDVCEYVVLPLTKASKCFFLETLDSQQEIGAPFQGAFVSQARKSNFSSMLGAIRGHFNEAEPATTFLWIDIFSANQQLLVEESPRDGKAVRKHRLDLLASGLHHAIAQFEECLVFFNNWCDPLPLQRAWCVWEFYGAAKSGKRLEIVLDPESGEDAVEQMIQYHNNVIFALNVMDLHKIDCFDPEDLRVIKESIAQLQGGFSTVRTVITDGYRRWLLRTIERAVIRRERDEEGTKSFGALLNQAGSVLALLGEDQVAESYLLKAKEVFSQLYGTETHFNVGCVYTNLGNIFSNREESLKALEMHTKAFEIFSKLEGIDRIDGLMHGHHNLGLGYLRMSLLTKDDEQEAARLLRLADENSTQAVALAEEHYSKNHPWWIEYALTLGEIHFYQGRLSEARQFFDQVLQSAKTVLGERSAAAAQAFHGLGLLSQKEGDLETARSCYQESHDIFTEVYGSAHEMSVNVQNAINQLLRNG